MKNNTSIIVSLLGGIALGSAVTCLVHSKGCKIGKTDIHKKIMDELEQLRSYVSSQLAEGACKCENQVGNNNQE
ncbi:MAG: hypothetical protein SNG38_07670 [Rikenellaceae bacterium]